MGNLGRMGRSPICCRQEIGSLPSAPELFPLGGWMPHPWRFHGWAAMPRGSGDFADVKLCFLGLID
jgi:hypothetical protein